MVIVIRNFKSVSSKEEYKFEIKKSIFFSEARIVMNLEEAEEFIVEVRNKHPKATHHCYAYSITEGGLKQKAEDDGEPGGTAGLPILKAITMNHLENCMIVVTRYFGGIKLGSGGLTRAYMAGATEVIKKAGIREFKLFYNVEIELTYDLYDIFLDYLIKNNIEILDTVFDASVKVTVSIGEEFCNAFKENVLNMSSGKAEFTILKEVRK